MAAASADTKESNGGSGGGGGGGGGGSFVMPALKKAPPIIKYIKLKKGHPDDNWRMQQWINITTDEWPKFTIRDLIYRMRPNLNPANANSSGSGSGSGAADASTAPKPKPYRLVYLKAGTPIMHAKPTREFVTDADMNQLVATHMAPESTVEILFDT